MLSYLINLLYPTLLLYYNNKRYISCNTILAALDGVIIIQLGKDHSILQIWING
jgi:hypothetical protein